LALRFPSESGFHFWILETQRTQAKGSEDFIEVSLSRLELGRVFFSLLR
jgi:hypothetical protein